MTPCAFPHLRAGSIVLHSSDFPAPRAKHPGQGPKATTISWFAIHDGPRISAQIIVGYKSRSRQGSWRMLPPNWPITDHYLPTSLLFACHIFPFSSPRCPVLYPH